MTVLYDLGTDIHECNRGLGECDLNATCINTGDVTVCATLGSLEMDSHAWVRNHI